MSRAIRLPLESEDGFRWEPAKKRKRRKNAALSKRRKPKKAPTRSLAAAALAYGRTMRDAPTALLCARIARLEAALWGKVSRLTGDRHQEGA